MSARGADEVRLTTRLRELRQEAGLTQDELALKVGVRRETIVHLEAGRYNPSLKLAWDIAKLFGQPIESVFRFESKH
ncbi:MAG: helix-turn-helix transcriptional regulator [Symbiobacteriia bacterium]